MGGRTGVVSVEYIDYVVARNLLNIVDEWFNVLPKPKTSKWWAFLRNRSELIPFFTRYFVGAVVAFLIFLALPKFIPEDASLLRFSQVFLCSAVGLFAAYRLARHLGRAAEYSMDRWSALSYICLTSGDRQAIEKARGRNRNSLIAAASKIVGALLVSIIAKIIIGVIPSV